MVYESENFNHFKLFTAHCYVFHVECLCSVHDGLVFRLILKLLSIRSSVIMMSESSIYPNYLARLNFYPPVWICGFEIG